MPVRLPQLGTAPTPQMSSVRMPGIAPRPPRLEMPVSDMRVSARDMAAPFVALAQLGQNIAGFGEKINGIALDLKETERRNTLAEIDLTAKATLSQTEVDLLKDGEPESHLSKFDAIAGKMRSDLLLRDMDPVTRKEAEMRIDNLNLTYRSGVAKRAAVGIIGREKGRADGIVDRAIQMGQPGTAIAHVKSLPPSIMDDAEKEAAIWKIEQAAADRDVLEFVATDPRGAKAYLDERGEDGAYKNATNIPFERRLQLAGHAEREINRENSKVAEDYIARMAKDDMPTSAEVIADMEEGKLDPRNATALLSRIEAENPPADDPELVADTIRRIEAFDPQRDYAANDSERTAILQTIATEFSPARQQTLLGRFNQKIKGEPITEYADQIHKYLDEGLDSGMFGKFKKRVAVDDFDVDGNLTKRMESVTVPELKAEAMERYLKTLERVDQLLLSPEAKKMPTAELFREVEKIVPRDPEQTRGATSILGGSRDPLARMNSIFGEDDPLTSSRGIPLNPNAGQSLLNFGGVPVKPLGEDWENVEGTVFGGKTDPNDKGINFRGQPTGPGGLEGVAMPQSVMASYGATKKSDYDNFRVLVRNGSNQNVFPVIVPIVDRGTAESVVEEAGKMKLDLTEGAVKAIGGKVTYNSAGKQAGTSGIGDLKFSVVRLPDTSQWGSLPWDAVRKQILRYAGDASDRQITNTMVVARNEWLAIRAAAGK